MRDYVDLLQDLLQIKNYCNYNKIDQALNINLLSQSLHFQQLHLNDICLAKIK